MGPLDPTTRTPATSAYLGTRGHGTVSWEEHSEAWRVYDRRDGGGSNSAERMAERGGFCLAELAEYLGRTPRTFVSDDAAYTAARQAFHARARAQRERLDQ